MSFTAECQWRGRLVSVTWDGGQLRGDNDLVAYLLSQEECGEPIAVERGQVIETSFRSRSDALDSLFSLIGPFSSVRGDIGAADPNDYLSDHLPEDRANWVAPLLAAAVVIGVLIVAVFVLA